MNAPNTIPAISVSHTPRRAADARRFARGIRTQADRLEVAGVVVVTNHWNRPGESVAVSLEVDDTRASSKRGRELAARLAALLTSAGLTPDATGGCLGGSMACRPIAEALDGTSLPLVHVSVPARFGDDLMRLAAVALRDLRNEGILFVGFSDVFGDVMSHERLAFTPRHEAREGVRA